MEPVGWHLTALGAGADALPESPGGVGVGRLRKTRFQPALARRIAESIARCGWVQDFVVRSGVGVFRFGEGV